jgi:transcriptional regulator with XRE-family HTH domain
MTPLMQQLKRLRRASGLSQLRLSQLSGVSVNRISLAESGWLQLETVEIRSLYRALLPELTETLRVVQEFQAGPLVAELTT